MFIDYGPAASAVGESLQAVKAHRFCDPLEEVGAADLTAHVDFAAMAHAAREAGARVHGAVAQATFLETLGIRTRAALLSAKAGEEDRAAIAQAMTRLIDPAANGQFVQGARHRASRPAGACRLSMITLGVLSDLPGIRHGFMTRAGGVSEGIYDSLNCGLGSDDEQARVLENRRRVLQHGRHSRRRPC